MKTALKKNKSYFIHPKALVESSHIGSNTRIWAFAHILTGAVIGKNVNVCDGCFIENNVVIGDRTTLKCGVYIWDGVTIEDDVFIGGGVAFTNDIYPRSKRYESPKKKTLLKKGCSVGTNTTLIAGITIGKYAMIGAGSVVTHDVNDFELVFGVPAVHKGNICVCTEKLPDTFGHHFCQCGREYTRAGNRISLIKQVSLK